MQVLHVCYIKCFRITSTPWTNLLWSFSWMKDLTSGTHICSSDEMEDLSSDTHTWCTDKNLHCQDGESLKICVTIRFPYSQLQALHIYERFKVAHIFSNNKNSTMLTGQILNTCWEQDSQLSINVTLQTESRQVLDPPSQMLSFIRVPTGATEFMHLCQEPHNKVEIRAS